MSPLKIALYATLLSADISMTGALFSIIMLLNSSSSPIFEILVFTNVLVDVFPR